MQLHQSRIALKLTAENYTEIMQLFRFQNLKKKRQASDVAVFNVRAPHV